MLYLICRPSLKIVSRVADFSTLPNLPIAVISVSVVSFDSVIGRRNSKVKNERI
jgi:hypothetical protein